ncbi:hypothetical protein ARMGADRAFT_436421 [Armillaria gallica]|uniref:Uncharacterized protein n=1 Tax=Armillaria gallica TaxID=47427 RepID=A0A2H3DGP8_ARMGA|nr:hypothetical protein ARMGADRAFT_436421 [Armillaria gallica]
MARTSERRPKRCFLPLPHHAFPRHRHFSVSVTQVWPALYIMQWPTSPCYFACTNALPLIDFSASRCLLYTTCARSSPVILPSFRHLLRGFYVTSSKLFCPYEDL